jgi:hypothetical protein
MNEEKGRGQTTQGIWTAMNLEYKVMILDCEGTDSKERGEDRFKFEHCSSLFALAMADLLIINMWTNVVYLFYKIGCWPIYRIELWCIKNRL